MEVFMDIAKCHEVHKIWTLLMLPKKRAEDCSRQCGSCKPMGGGAYKRHAICIKDWVCFDTSADHFWTLNGLRCAPCWRTTLPEGRPTTSDSSVTLNPSESSAIFKKKLEVLVTFMQYIRTLKKGTLLCLRYAKNFW